MTGVVLLPRMRWWFRGPAKRVGEWIEFDGRHAEWYDPSAEIMVGLRLARVRTPDDAVSFVRQFGLLSCFENEGIAKTSVGMDMMGTRPAKVEITSDFDYRERTEDILHDAKQLNDALRTALRARQAAQGNNAAREVLRRDMDRNLALTNHPDHKDWRPDETPEAWMSRMVTARMDQPLQRSRVYLVSTAPGKFEIRLMATTLLDYCYLSVAHILASEPLAVCSECDRVFVVEDKRQKFCEPKCAGRARFRTYKTRAEQSARSVSRKGGKRGKTTRSR